MVVLKMREKSALGQVIALQVSNLAEIKGNLLHGEHQRVVQPPTGWTDSP